MTILKRLLFILFSTCLAYSNFAQWQQTSLDTAHINCLETKGDSIIAGGYGVFLSVDQGNNWSTLNTGFPTNIIIKAFAFKGDTIFAGGNGMYKSTNGGYSWSAINTGLPTNVSIDAIAVKGNLILAGTNDGNDLYLSQNNGSNWVPSGNGMGYITSILIKDSIVFAGSFGGGIYTSYDNCNSWTQNDSSFNTNIQKIAKKGDTIFVGTCSNYLFIDSGVLYSIDNGNTWVTCNDTGLASYVNIFDFAFYNSIIFVTIGQGGIFISSDNGNSWISQNYGLPPNTFRLLARTITTFNNYIFAGIDSIGSSNIYGQGIWRLPLSEVGLTENINTLSNLLICPNPANDIITFESYAINNGANIFIYDIKGQLLSQKQLLQTRTDIDISQFAKGLYFIKFSNGDKIEMIKFLKE